MPKNKNFIAARLPQELYNRLKTQAEGKEGGKTKIIVEAIAAYLDFPLNTVGTTVDSSERFLALENRIKELEQQFQEFKSLVIISNRTDNKRKPSVISDDKKPDNKNTLLIESNGSIGPAPESQIADFMKISRRALAYHRKTLKKTGKSLNHAKRLEYENKPYDLICQGESKSRGQTVFLWIAKPVIEEDNKIYQPDITEYQPNNNLKDAPQAPHQEEHKQDSEKPQLSDNSSYQTVSIEPNINQEQEEQEEQEENEKNLESLGSLDNTSYQQLSEESDIDQEEDDQNLQNLTSTDNSSYQSLSIQSNFNEELNKQQQDSDRQSTEEHQPEEEHPKLAKEEQPEF